MNIDDILAAAGLPERTARVCLNARLLDELAAAESAHAAADARSEKAAEANAETMAGRKAVKRLSDEVARLRALVDEQAIAVTFRGLPFTRYNELLQEHPPRDGNAADKGWGFNTSTFFPVLVRTCMVQPEMTDEQWGRAVAVMNDKTWDRLALDALAVNRGEDSLLPF